RAPLRPSRPGKGQAADVEADPPVPGRAEPGHVQQPIPIEIPTDHIEPVSSRAPSGHKLADKPAAGAQAGPPSAARTDANNGSVRAESDWLRRLKVPSQVLQAGVVQRGEGIAFAI